MDTIDLTIAASSITAYEALRASVGCKLTLPGEAEYEQARMAWNLSIQQHPDMILLPDTAEDIVQAVDFINQLRTEKGIDLGIAIQATGHGVRKPANDCLLINTSQMIDVYVDPNTSSAWISAGAQWGTVLEAAHAHGLAPLLGSSPGVGAVGYTLGGGLGWLARKYGLSTDSVLAFEVVTADGRLEHASKDVNPDLFWALRGGGGSFAVITAMQIRLYPVAQVFGGSLIYPVELAPQVFPRFRDWTAGLPQDWTTSVKIANFPPVELVPEFFRGKSFVMVNGCYCGPVEQGAQAIQEWLDWQDPLLNGFKVMPFSEVAVISNDPVHPLPSYETGAWMKDLSADAIDTIIDYAVPKGGPPIFTIVEVRHVGGALSQVDHGSTAFSWRDADLLLEVIAFVPSPEAHDLVESTAVRFKQELEPHLSEGVYMNFLNGKEARRRTAEAFTPQKYARLKALKAKYDPDNLFRFGYDINP